VETVGSVYMVVSGMPQRNGERHVTEIANMAVDIRSAVNGVTMTRRRGDVQIQLRIGIHTGQLYLTSYRGQVNTRAVFSFPFFLFTLQLVKI